MAYSDKKYGVGDVGTLAAIDLTSAATQTFSKVFLSKMKIQRIALLVAVATVSTGNIVVTFYRRPTYGSDTGRVSLGAITIPTAATVGQVYYKDVSEANLKAGEQLVYVVSTAAAGGSAAGQAIPLEEYFYDPEVPSGEANMVASA